MEAARVCLVKVWPDDASGSFTEMWAVINAEFMNDDIALHGLNQARRKKTPVIQMASSASRVREELDSQPGFSERHGT